MRGARWEEIDTAQKLWVVPADRMKAGRSHRVPLSDAAMQIIGDMAGLRHADDGGFVFQGTKRGQPLGETALLRALRRIGRDDLHVHGFRSSFRDWASEQTSFSHEAVELALAHLIGDATVRAYARGDLLEKRRQLMQAWASYCAAPVAENVIPMRKQAST